MQDLFLDGLETWKKTMFIIGSLRFSWDMAFLQQEK